MYWYWNQCSLQTSTKTNWHLFQFWNLMDGVSHKFKLTKVHHDAQNTSLIKKNHTDLGCQWHTRTAQQLWKYIESESANRRQLFATTGNLENLELPQAVKITFKYDSPVYNVRYKGIHLPVTIMTKLLELTFDVMIKIEIDMTPEFHLPSKVTSRNPWMSENWNWIFAMQQSH